MTVPRFRHGSSILLLVLAAGCGADPRQTYPVAGEVNFHGEPLEQGTIDFFRPEEPGRRVAGGMILDGHYDISAEFGLMRGEYLVRISSAVSPEKLGPENTRGGFPINQERIPPDFNVNSKLKIEVPPRANTFDIDIP